jgi:programmed cell death protein 5
MEHQINPEVQKRQEEQARAAEEQREVFLTQILTPSAKERLARIALVKQDKARELENSLIQMAMKRQITGKVTEEQLISLLEKTSAQGNSSIKIVRRRGASDSDDDDLDDL